jgi:hypothetical protein
MWDCIGHRRRGGGPSPSAAVGDFVSHPHFMSDGGVAFGVHLPETDQRVMRPDPAIEFYGFGAAGAGVRLVRMRRALPGAPCPLACGAAGRCAVTGDTFIVVRDRTWVSVMWSTEPHPLDVATVRGVEPSPGFVSIGSTGW